MSDDVWGVIMSVPREAREAIGEDKPWVSQAWVIVRARSRAAAARALIDSGLEHRSPAAVSAWLAQWGGTTGNERDLAVAREPGVVFIRQLDDHRGEYVQWPMEGTP